MLVSIACHARPGQNRCCLFCPLSLKDKNQGELIPPVLRFTVTYLREKGEWELLRGAGGRGAACVPRWDPFPALSTPGWGAGGGQPMQRGDRDVTHFGTRRRLVRRDPGQKL